MWQLYKNPSESLHVRHLSEACVFVRGGNFADIHLRVCMGDIEMKCTVNPGYNELIGRGAGNAISENSLGRKKKKERMYQIWYV